MLSEPFQLAIPEGNWMYPAASSSGLPPSFGALGKPEKSLFIPPDVVRDNRRAWLDEWLASMSK
jgi:thiamine transport system substrate-binding protein